MRTKHRKKTLLSREKEYNKRPVRSGNRSTKQSDAMWMWPKATICSKKLVCAFVSVHLIWFKDPEHCHKIDSTEQRQRRRKISNWFYLPYNVSLYVWSQKRFSLYFLPLLLGAFWLRKREIRKGEREISTKQAKTKSTKILLIIISTNFSSDAMRSRAPSFIIIIMWSSRVKKKLHTSPARTTATTKLRKKRNYILRYSLEIDERLTATQLCLSDCNLIISITQPWHSNSCTAPNKLFFVLALLLACFGPLGKYFET